MQSAARVTSQLKRIARAIYSNPPAQGARIVAEVVGNEDMFGANHWSGLKSVHSGLS
jgi:aspartate aminotransferase